MILKWFNFYGLTFLAAIMIPNVVFAYTHKNGFENRYSNKCVEILEQIGRVGCFVFIFVSVPPLVKGFWFDGGELVYIICGSALTLAYVIGWLMFWRENSIRKSLFLSIVPSLMFIVCGVVSLNIPLIAASVIFAPCHVHISYKNAKPTE